MGLLNQPTDEVPVKNRITTTKSTMAKIKLKNGISTSLIFFTQAFLILINISFSEQSIESEYSISVLLWWVENKLNKLIDFHRVINQTITVWKFIRHEIKPLLQRVPQQICKYLPCASIWRHPIGQINVCSCGRPLLVPLIKLNQTNITGGKRDDPIRDTHTISLSFENDQNARAISTDAGLLLPYPRECDSTCHGKLQMELLAEYR